MDEMLDGILLNNLGSSIKEALHDGLPAATFLLLCHCIVAASGPSRPTDATVAARSVAVQKGQRISNHGRKGKSRFLQ